MAAFAPLAALLAASRAERARAEPGPRPRRLALRLLIGLAGLLVGAELLVYGTERIVSELGMSETLFGLLAVAAAVSFEEVVLEMLPAHRGHPEISVGNAHGTTLFLLTASLGLVALARPVAVPDGVRTLHLPALGASVLLVRAMLLRGRMGCPEGALLLAAYGGYVGLAVLLT